MSSNESLISSLKTVSPRVENEKNPSIMCRTCTYVLYCSVHYLSTGYMLRFSFL